MTNAYNQRVHSVTRSAKASLFAVPYDPVLYGDEIANELNKLDKGFNNNNDTLQKTEHGDKPLDVGSDGDFNAVAQSYPFEMILETKVCGPAYDRQIERQSSSDETNTVLVENELNTDHILQEERCTRDEITFISKLQEQPTSPEKIETQGVSSKSIFKFIGPKAHQVHDLVVTDDLHANLTVRKQLTGRLVKTNDSNFKANFSHKENTQLKSEETNERLSSIMIVYRDQTLHQYQSYFEAMQLQPEKSNGFSGRIIHELDRGRLILDSVAREARKIISKVVICAKRISSNEEAANEAKVIEMTLLLFHAIDAKEVKMVKTALSQGALVNEIRSTKYGRTPFQTIFVRICKMDAGLEACSKIKESEDIIDVLFSHGCDINKFDDAKSCHGWAPIHYAAMYGKLKRAQWINSRGGDLNSITSSKQSPLMFACQSGRFEIAYYLVRNNANFRGVDCQHRTVLHYTAMSGNKRLLEFLVKCGAAEDKLKKCHDGETPLSICKQVCSECYEYLQKATLERQPMSIHIERMIKEGNK